MSSEYQTDIAIIIIGAIGRAVYLEIVSAAVLAVADIQDLHVWIYSLAAVLLWVFAEAMERIRLKIREFASYNQVNEQGWVWKAEE